MRWTIKRVRWQASYSQGVKKKCVFKVSHNRNTKRYYFTAIKEGEFTFNSLWHELDFTTEDEAKTFCENFKHEDFKTNVIYETSDKQ